MVHSLVESYGLLTNLASIPCDKVDDNILEGFHSADYLSFIKGEIDEEEDDNEEYGLGVNHKNLSPDELNLYWRFHSGYDCPPLEKLHNFIQTIAGGSVSGARALVTGAVDVAVNFCGGWHHAQRDEASGFCYVNDWYPHWLSIESHDFILLFSVS